MRVNNCCFNLSGAKKACWIIENSCNLNCDFCFHKQFARTPKKSSVDYISTVAELKRKNIRNVILSGGEPLINEDIFKIIDILESENIDVSICTNAVFANQEFCSKLKHTRVKKITVNIACISDKRGYLSKKISHYSAVVHGIKQLIKNGFKVSLNDLVKQDTDFMCLKEKVMFAVQCNVRQISFTIPVCRHTFELETSQHEDMLNTIFTELQQIETAANDIDIVLNNPLCFDIDCPANKKIFGIGNDGKISTCLIKLYQQGE